MLSSKTIEAFSSPRMMRQNAHVTLSCGSLTEESGMHLSPFVPKEKSMRSLAHQGVLFP